MNYLDLLPDDITTYIFDIVDDMKKKKIQYDKKYYKKVCKMLSSKYQDFNLSSLVKIYKVPNIRFIYDEHTNKDIEKLYTLIMIFNHKNNYKMNIYKSIKVIDNSLKQLIPISDKCGVKKK